MSDPVGSTHHVGILVRDLDQAEAFATAVLGLPVVSRIASEEHRMRAAFLACGPTLIELVEFSDPDLVATRLGDRVAAIDHVALEVEDVEEAARGLGAHGVETVAQDPLELPSGRTHFTKPETSMGVIWQLLELK